MDFREQNFSDFSIFWKVLIVIGSISILIFLVLLVIIVSLMFESKINKKEEDLSEYDDFLNEFTNGIKEEIEKEEEDYPSLPKIKDFDGKNLRNLMDIKVL